MNLVYLCTNLLCVTQNNKVRIKSTFSATLPVHDGTYVIKWMNEHEYVIK